MKKTITLLCCCIQFFVFGQTKTPEELGFRHITYTYQGDVVDVIVKSKKGEENQPKPLFFFCQGSLPDPTIKYLDDRVLVFPFDMETYAEQYHLVIVGKPGSPLVLDLAPFAPSYQFRQAGEKVPQAYTDRNYLSYYVERNIEVLQALAQEEWVSSDQLVVAGHSEGSTIGAKMALLYPEITHLIYSGGNPMGRIMSIITEYRYGETEADQRAEHMFDHWEWILDNKESVTDERGDSPRATYEFSEPSFDVLEQLKIPVLVTYGSKDWSAPFNDYLHLEALRKGWTNFTFKAYIGTEHNFFPVNEQYVPDHKVRNWPKVATDWLTWLTVNGE